MKIFVKSPKVNLCNNRPVVRVAVVSLKDDHEGEESEEVRDAVTDPVHGVAQAGGTDHVALGVAVLPLPVDAAVQGVDVVADLTRSYIELSSSITQRNRY